MSETVTIVGDGITIDLLLWRRWGEQGQTLLERTLALNPGLAARGAVLPLRTRVRLPAGRAPAVETAVAIDLFS